MELVYLWVEKYKNIKEEGFNLSSKYDCKFDGTNLTIEPKEHISNFFDKEGKINITAIVGENGSGKSSIFKVIISVIYNYKSTIHINIDLRGTFLVFKSDDGKNKYISFDDRNLIGDLSKYEEEIDFYSLNISYMIDTLKDNEKESYFDEVYHRVDNYETPILLEPFKKNEKIDLNILSYVTQQVFAKQFSINSSNYFIENFFKPTHVMFKINTDNFVRKIDEAFRINGGIYGLPGNPNYVESVVLPSIEIWKDKLANINKNTFSNINSLYIGLKLIEKNLLFNERIKGIVYDIITKSYPDVQDKKDLREQITLFVEESINNLIREVDSDIEDIKTKIEESSLVVFEKEKLLKAIEFKEKVLDSGNEALVKIDKKLDLKPIQAILVNLPSWIDIEYYEDLKSYSSLSSGEKTIFSFFSNLNYQVNNVKNCGKYNTINIFLDEIDLTLHPNWQKDIITLLLESLGNIDIKINIVMTSHSSFILSDLPKQNIIFLKDGKQVDGIEKKETFGANIHTLLSDGFFMSDGLMGEFAKSKIDKVIECLNQKTLSEKDIFYCEDIISIVGEPILKRQMQKMLDSKRLSEIDLIKKQIKELEKELDKKENKK